MRNGSCRFSEVTVRIQRPSRDGKLVFDMMVRLEGTYDPGYPPPPCSDPDHPSYSDPGSPPELEVLGINRVEDVVVAGPEGEQPPDLSHLSYYDRCMLNAIEHAHTASEKEKLAAKDCSGLAEVRGHCTRATEHDQLAGWLEELFAARQGVGPWNQLELDEEELQELDGEILAQVEEELRRDEWDRDY